MRRLSSNALPGIMLVIVIFWALFAVLLLTGIISTANRIESRVGVINNAVAPINTKLDVVPVLAQIQDTAGQIRDSSAALSGIVGRVSDSAVSIDNSAKQINGTVLEINKSAASILDSAQQINTSVRSIAPQLVTILASAESINNTVNQIGPTFIQIVDLVYDIKTRVVVASTQADDIIRSAQGIKGDTGFISNQVDLINNNALGIETSPLLLNFGNAGVMREMNAASGAQGPAAQVGLPAFDLLPPVPALALPALPLPAAEQLTSELSKTLLGLPVLSDTGDLLGLVGATPK